AQFGRGMIQDISQRLTQEFADCLKVNMATTEPASGSTTAQNPTEAGGGKPPADPPTPPAPGSVQRPRAASPARRIRLTRGARPPPDATPSVRIVLLRGFEAAGGFVSFTNYESAKAGALRANPRAAVVFHWPELHRQVRASGAVERLSTPESEAYWAGRPRDHR